MRGASHHVVGGYELFGASTELSANLATWCLIQPGWWLDRQLQQSAPTEQWRYEGTLNGIWVPSSRFTFKIFALEYHEGYVSFAPFFLAYYITELVDLIQQGNPNDFGPNVIPNYFQRDWGRIESVTVSFDPSPTVPLVRPARTLHRVYGLLNCSDPLAATNDPLVWQHSVRLPRFHIKRNQGLFLEFAAYTSLGTVACTWQHAGTFGYRHVERQ